MTIPVAFAAGVTAFFSPCVFPLLPVWLAFIGGNTAGSKSKLAVNLLFFVAGFSLVFSIFGASATLLGQLLLRYQLVMIRVAGVILILFGLQMLGLFRLSLLHRKFGVNFKPQQNKLGYFLFGVVLAVGWTPCVGMILASILMLAGSLQTVGQGMLLLFVFSLGFASPFFVGGLIIGPKPLTRLSGKATALIFKGAGIIMIIMGLMLFFNRWTWLQSMFI